MQRASLARADAARLQAAANLTGTLLARVNALKATATPEEAAQLDAEVPVLQRGQKDLQAGIDHLNSFIDQAGTVANEATDDYQIASNNTQVIANAGTGIVKGSILPKTNGSWSGTPGESDWISTRPDVNAATGNQPIPFANCYPNFAKWKYVEDGVDGEVTISGFTTRPDDFDAADDAYAVARGWFKQDGTPNRARVFNLRKSNSLTWHHHEDKHTMQLIPSAINNKIPHQGGFSLSH